MLFLGSSNPGKIREFGGLLAPMGVTVQPLVFEVEETGTTFVDNARQKALAFAAKSGGVTVAEDSGLVVSALNGLPGPFSARFADLEIDGALSPVRVNPSGRSREVMDPLNNARVLELMAALPEPKRAASFVVRLVVALRDRILFEAGGEAHGWITTEPRGERGFGYDPIFVGQDTFGKTYAELDPMRKNLRSHRRRVLQEFQFWLAKAIKDGTLPEAL
jgi:XTP/dITP diphosphohydrolase